MNDVLSQATMNSKSGSFIPRILSWILLIGFLSIDGIARGIYASQGIGPSPRFQLLAMLCVIALLWFWFFQQMSPYSPGLVMNVGLLFVLFWFLIVPYYMWRYERWRGVLKVASVIGIYIFAWMLSIVVYAVLS